jgi:hypothetical protein
MKLSILYTDCSKHALAFTYGATAAEETEDHDDGTNSNNDVCSSTQVMVQGSRIEHLRETFLVDFDPNADSKKGASCQLHTPAHRGTR